jgi:hypothetical protein
VAFSLHRVIGIVSLSMVMMAAVSSHPVSAAPVLTALYDPTDGNIKMQALNNGVPANLSIATFQFLSPALYLSGTAASIPSPAASLFTVLNTAVSTMVDPASVHAEIYATNLGGGTPLFAGTWDLGDVAATGLTQSQINVGFTTDADVSPGNQPLPGQFLYQVQGDSAFYAGQITAVPEPTTLLLGVSACVVGCLAAVRRKTIA